MVCIFLILLFWHSINLATPPPVTAGKTNFMVFIAADNDLNYFAWKNIEQQISVGSNDNVTICVQLNERPKNKNTQRYLIQKNKAHAIPMAPERLNSGDPNTLIDFCNWAISSYPAQKYVLVLWNHGTGIIDPYLPKAVNPADLFVFNPINNMLELDRNIEYLNLLMATNDLTDNEYRGICFDETYHTYLTNEKLEYALGKICNDSLQGQKIDIVAFDACLMSMIEIASMVKKYAHVMISSQEVELGSGYNYQKVLQPFINSNPDRYAFAKHIVKAYEEAYSNKTNDYTQSAIDLSLIDSVEQNVNTVALLLIEALQYQKDNTAKNIIKMCRSRRLCTVFDEPSYIDLHHFYDNLLANIEHLKCVSTQKDQEIKTKLTHALQQGMGLIRAAVLENSVGKNLMHAKGISIYFPEYKIFGSYRKTGFATSNAWLLFITQFLLL